MQKNKLQLALLVAFFCFFLIRGEASAAIVFNPSDQTAWQAWEATSPGGGYVSGQPVFANNGGAQIYSKNGFSAGTYYVVLSTTGSTGHVQTQRYNGSSLEHTSFVTGFPSQTWLFTPGSSGDFLQYGAGSTAWVSDTDAVTTWFCVSDVSYAECAPPSPPPTPSFPLITPLADTFGSTTCAIFNPTSSNPTINCTSSSTPSMMLALTPTNFILVWIGGLMTVSITLQVLRKRHQHT